MALTEDDRQTVPQSNSNYDNSSLFMKGHTMKTKKQEELIHSFLSDIDDEACALYQDIIFFLSELGYHPKKQRSYIVFIHDLHNKQMAKIGINRRTGLPFFALRFSACRGYSQRFSNIVRDAVSKGNYSEAMCMKNSCAFCRGEAKDRVYTYTFPNGETKYHCGASTLEIPDIKEDDMEEIKQLIQEEHQYFLKNEAGICWP